MRRLLLLILMCCATTSTLAGELPPARPAEVGLDPSRLAAIDDAIAGAVERREVPGAVVLVGRRGRIAHARAIGRRSTGPTDEAMTRETIFDLASLTKPVATAAAILILRDRGQIRLDDPVARHWPEFAANGKAAITVEQLLRHRSGLIADNPLADYADGEDRAWERVAALGLTVPPGSKFVYSDVNYLVLGKLVERIAGQPLDGFARAAVFEPMGVGATFNPAPSDRIAPTEREGGAMLRGTVHDPRARALHGVAGHAGLFGTADDLAVVAQTWLDDGVAPNGKRILAAATTTLATDPGSTPPGERRGLGWDIATPFSGGPKGDGFGPRSFGHTGFTGTSVWIDPDSGMFVVLLTSRLHPDGKAPSPTRLRREVATLAAAAIADRPPLAEPRVACGVDVLARDGFKILAGKRVGLVTNHTGRTRTGTATIDALAHAPGVQLVALFSPEHGIRGLVDAEVADSRDEATGLPIHSLYATNGKTRRPPPGSLDGIDVLVYDIQDIGTRFYTYITALGRVLEAAQERGIAVVVLDRPNPIGGLAVAGPVCAAVADSSTAYHALPVRHGMTAGEIARLLNAERPIHADLTVVPCEGWRRGDLYDDTGLIWINPSPNMRSLTEALIYPGVGLLELSNLATGRGTDTPFERLGAPWIDPVTFARNLNDRGLPGVRFTPIRFTPEERQYAGQECGGVQVAITDRGRFEPVGAGIAIAGALRQLHRDAWKPAGFARMLADDATAAALLAGRPLPEIEAGWRTGLDDFRAVRAKYLLYPEGP